MAYIADYSRSDLGHDHGTSHTQMQGVWNVEILNDAVLVQIC